VIPPSDLARTRPLARLILNQIARRLTESLPLEATPERGRLLLLLDEFPALGRLDFFESSLAFLAGYGVRVFLVAQSLHQIDKAYGVNHAILDNCHVRVAFAPNDERTARRLSDALGTATELRTQRNLSGSRLAAFLSYVSISQQETPRPLLTAGEILQLPPSDALVLVSGVPPIRARKLRYFADRNFLLRRLPAPDAAKARNVPARPHDWVATTAEVHGALEGTVEPVIGEGDGTRELSPERDDARGDLSLLLEHGAEEAMRAPEPAADAAGDDETIAFPGGVRV
jgi:type IV secretion system protein VirD4